MAGSNSSIGATERTPNIEEKKKASFRGCMDEVYPRNQSAEGNGSECEKERLGT